MCCSASSQHFQLWQLSICRAMMYSRYSICVTSCLLHQSLVVFRLECCSIIWSYQLVQFVFGILGIRAQELIYNSISTQMIEYVAFELDAVDGLLVRRQPKGRDQAEQDCWQTHSWNRSGRITFNFVYVCVVTIEMLRMPWWVTSLTMHIVYKTNAGVGSLQI